MNLQDIILSKISQSQEDKYCESSYMRYLEQSNSETESRVVIARVLGGMNSGELIMGIEFQF